MDRQLVTRLRTEHATFTRWLASNRDRIEREATPVSMVRYSAMPGVVEILQDVRTQSHDCHATAFNVARALERQGLPCSVVQGIAVRTAPRSFAEVAHSWNETDGWHFDAQGQHRSGAMACYLALQRFTVEEYAALVLETGMHEWWIPRLWRSNRS